ncbi:hypothetical protein U9M48_023223, partial [Paspalum notatum var. saurae]
MGDANKIARKIYSGFVSSDRISGLPEELRCKILSYLNAEEAVRASILSSIWKDMWMIMPQILLSDESSLGCTESSPEIARFKFITLVDLTLARHKGTLDTISIELRKRNYDDDELGRWVDMLSEKKPLGIAIKLPKFTVHMIPSSLFLIGGLERLHLERCIIRLPPTFEGFQLLKVLKLESFFSADDSDISKLISNSPLLGTLVLDDIFNTSFLNIRAEALHTLVVKGYFDYLHLHAPNLTHACFVAHNYFEDYESDPVQDGFEDYLEQAFGSLVRIKTLSVNYRFLMYLSKGNLLTKLPGALGHLTTITIEGCLQNRAELLAACALFQNAPMLRELEIWSQNLIGEDIIFNENPRFDEDYSNIEAPTLDRLVTIIFHDFMALECEIALLGSLLSWAPALEEVKIDVDKRMMGQCICKETEKLLALPRASTKAKI